MPPRAPIAAASAGVARPPRIDPRTRRISSVNGTNDTSRSRIDRFLSIASGVGIRTMLVLFDDCWFPAKAGPQPEPVTGADDFVLCFPGDEAHTVEERALPGPTRLRYDEQRWLPA